MKSRLFKSNEAFKEDSVKLEPVKRDLAALLSIGDNKLAAFVKAVGQMLSTNVSEHERIAKGALPKLGVERSTFDHASNVAGWLATEFYPSGHAKGDTPGDIADDLIALKAITEKQRDKCVTFVAAIKLLVQEQLRPDVEKELALRKDAPKVVGVDTALFFRNLLRKGPGSGETSNE